MTTSIGNINTFSYGTGYGSGPAAASGKLYVPVSKSALLYSHFDHVSGVAASGGQSGVSISKLRILNSLIDHCPLPEMSLQPPVLEYAQRRISHVPAVN